MRFERQPTLNSVIGALHKRVSATESSLQRLGTKSFASSSTFTTSGTSGVVIWESSFTTASDSLLEVYAHALGTTNGANKYGELRVWVDGVRIYADYLLQWGTSTAAVTDERRRTYPSSHLGTTDRLGGFLVAQDLDSGLLPAGEHDISFELWPVGTSATASVRDVAFAYRAL